MATPYVDLALAYDAETRRCDYVFNGTDIALDDTPATPLIIAIGTDRRARPDDDVPNDDRDPTRPSSLLARRGWPGDALDTRSRRIGSRIWVFLTRKQTEPVRRGIEGAAAEALAFFEQDRFMAVELAVRYPRRNVALLLVDVAGTAMQLEVGLGA